MATDKAVMVEGGDTIGQNWIPRSQMLDGTSEPTKHPQVERDGDVGDEGEVWVPQWLADKIPWR